MKLLSLSIVIALLLGGCGAKPEEETKPQPVVAVTIAKPQVADVPLTVSAPATIFPREQATIAARVTAPIRELLVRKGDFVQPGQILARLDNRDILAQRREALANIADAEATLNKVRSGTLPTDIEHAQGQVLTTKAALDQAQKFYERRKQLFDQGAIPNRDLVVSETDLAQAKANFDVAQRSLELLQKQSGERDIQIAQSRVEQARARLQTVDAQNAFTEIRSPFSGTIIDQMMFPGDMAQPSAPLFTIADLSIAIARAQVPESAIARVKLNQRCTFQSGDQERASGDGRISVINQAVDPARRTVEVWCEIPNSKSAIRAQVFGTVDIITGSLTQALLVPASAVQLNEGTRQGFVLVVGDDHIAHRRDVQVGSPINGQLPVLQGLQANESVVTGGGYALADGTAVETSGKDTAAKIPAEAIQK